MTRKPALLVLEDGRTFRGESYGAEGETFGEAVFSTGMTGYQETLTDPSYHRQVVVMTAPHVGNTGVNDEDPESRRIWVAGYVVRDPARMPSNWRSRRSLDDALAAEGVVGISGVDTRALTRHLRERGAMRVGVSSVETDPAALRERVLASPPMTGAALVDEVTAPEPYVVPARGRVRARVAALDLGIKSMTPYRMAERGIEVHVLPSTSTLAEVLAIEPDGVFMSNGPGDPEPLHHVVDLVRGVLRAGTPFFGICLGNQVFGLALGFPTYKLKYGHRGINLPVQDRTTGKVEVTAHNHGFAVAWPGAETGQVSAGGQAGREHGHSAVAWPGAETGQVSAGGQAGREHGHSAVGAPVDHPVDTEVGTATVSHVCLNDGVVEGLELRDGPTGEVKAFSVQYHPEAAAGPHDAGYLFDRFTDMMERATRGRR